VELTPLTVDVGDIATAVLAFVAIVVSIAVAIVQHRSSGPLVKVKVVAFARLQRRPEPGKRYKAPDYDNLPSAIGPLSSIPEMHDKYGADNFVRLYLRVVITNHGRMPITVENVGYENREGKAIAFKRKDGPQVPFALEPFQHFEWDEMFNDLPTFAGRYAMIRFRVGLSNGERIMSRWIKVYPAPAAKERPLVT